MKHCFLSLCALFLFSACAPHILVVTDEAGVPVGNAFVIRTARPSFLTRKSITVTDSNGIAEVSPVHLTVGKPGFMPNSCSGQGLVTTCQLARIPAGPPPYQYVPGVDDVFFVLYAGTNALARKPSPLWQSYDAYLLDLYKRGYYQRSEDLGYLTPDSPYGRQWYNVYAYDGFGDVITARNEAVNHAGSNPPPKPNEPPSQSRNEAPDGGNGDCVNHSNSSQK